MRSKWLKVAKFGQPKPAQIRPVVSFIKNYEKINTVKPMTKKAFMVNSQNIKQATGIQVTFIWEIKLQ